MLAREAVDTPPLEVRDQVRLVPEKPDLVEGAPAHGILNLILPIQTVLLFCDSGSTYPVISASPIYCLFSMRGDFPQSHQS